MATGRVYLSVHGDGSAYTDAVPPLVDGESFKIYSTPNIGATLDDIRLWTSYDESIATEIAEKITVIYRSAYKNIYADIYFSGSPEPPGPGPSPTPILKKFPWLLAKVAQDWRE